MAASVCIFSRSVPRHSPRVFAKRSPPPQIRNVMRRAPQIVLLLCWLLLGSSALAEHQSYLRGLVNIPGLQAALFEIQHTLVKRSNAPPVITTTSRLVRAQEQFEDQTVKGRHFQFEVREIDFHKETVKTREAGEEHTYTLLDGSRIAGDNWLLLRNAAFKDVLDVYSRLAGRTVLLHPAIARAAVSLKAEWTNQAPQKAEITAAFEEYFKSRGISTILDGEKFVQLVPSNLVGRALPRAKDLPAGAPEIGAIHLENVECATLVQMYAETSGRRRIGSEPLWGSVSYLHAQALSKPEASYALETLLGWSGLRIVLGDDNTFSLERVQR